MNLSLLLWGIPQAMRVAARVYPEYAARLKERDLVAQIRIRDTVKGRWIKLDKGKISTGSGIHATPDVTIGFKDAALAKSFLTPPFDQLERIDAAKNYKILLEGPDDLSVWFLPVGSSRHRNNKLNTTEGSFRTFFLARFFGT